MRDDICTIPVSEVFEEHDGCPICRMRDTITERILDYILGDAMMEPDVRIETNKKGFCTGHMNSMMNRRGRLQFALMLQTHIEEVNRKIFGNSLLNSDSKKGEKAKKLTESCFVCDKIEWGLSRMIDTIYRCYENERDFRELFDAQPMFCLPHYERLIGGADRKTMKSYSSAFTKNITRITGDYVKGLYDDVSKYCSMYDYRSAKTGAEMDEVKDSVERTVAFLSAGEEDD